MTAQCNLRTSRCVSKVLSSGGRSKWIINKTESEYFKFVMANCWLSLNISIDVIFQSIGYQLSFYMLTASAVIFNSNWCKWPRSSLKLVAKVSKVELVGKQPNLSPLLKVVGLCHPLSPLACILKIRVAAVVLFRWNLIYVTRITNGSPRQLNLWAALEVTPFIQKVAMAYLIDSLNCNIKFVPASSIGLFQSINTCLSFQMIEDGSNMRLSKWFYQSRGNEFLWSREKKNSLHTERLPKNPSFKKIQLKRLALN